MFKFKSPAVAKAKAGKQNYNLNLKSFDFNKIINLSAKLLIIIGLIIYIFGAYLVWERNNPDRLAFKNYTGNFKYTKVKNPPTRISVKDLKIDLPIFPAQVKNGKWDTTVDGASFLISSPSPGETGNSIIYAHDWASLFGPMVNIKKGMDVQIVFQDGSIRNFVIINTSIVPFDNSGVLAQTDDKRITLYTCTGFLDTQRLVAVALYKNDLLLSSNK